MAKNTDNRWALRLATLALWLLAGASVVYWGLRLSAPAAGVPVPAAAAALPQPDAAALARLLGVMALDAPAVVAAPVASVASRFALVGVLAGRSSGAGAALIAVDSQPAKPFRVGAKVDAGLVLQSVGARQARLGAALRGPTLVTLEIPARP
ncbi:MAG: general secretion pathway protein C [Giesbergeria sp.]|nr:general secretion pathway protein C [Giesbergeria sp.]